MNRRYRIGYWTAALLVAGSCAGVAPASNASSSRATLRVVSERPLWVRGAGFRAREPVRVTVRTDQQTWVRETRAGTRGAFTVVFRVRIDFCSSNVQIVAVGRYSGTVRARIPIRSCPN